jgi:ActD protein
MELDERTERALVEHGALHGVMAEFESAQACVDAARRAAAEGFTRFEAYTPVPVEELNTIIHVRRTKLPMATLIGGLTGMAAGFALQYWAAVLEYPMNIGGRPFASWPSFVVPSYELTILFSALTATLFMIIANGLPQPYHPVFNVPRFSMASSDKFFLVIEAEDPRFEATGTSQFLQTLGARGVYDVPA